MDNEKTIYQDKLKKNIKILIQNNRLEEAKELMTQYEDIITNDIDTYAIKSVIAMVEGDINKAEEILLNGLDVDKDNFDLLYNLGYLYQINEQKELSIKYYKKTIINSDNENEANQVYEILKELGVGGSKEEIIESSRIENNRKICDEEEKSHLNEMEICRRQFKENIQSLIEQGLLPEAKEMVDQYEEIIKEDVDIYSIKGVIAMMEGDIDDADEVLKRGLLIDGQNFNLLYNLGYLYQQYGDKELAIKYYKKAFSNAKNEFDANGVYELLRNLGLKERKEDIGQIKVKKKVVFFPYKITMWDSLETIYEAFVKDEDFIVDIVPIPYYQLSKDEAIPIYEGMKFPSNIPIVHYREYNLEEERPDIIFVHNIYDGYNTLTRVFDEYFTSNLKKYTEMLVYVPYHISSFVEDSNTLNLAYYPPTINNVSKTVLVGEHVKRAAIKDGIEEDKLLVLGSPKIDRIVRAMKQGIDYPEKWKEQIEGKTVFALNTGCLFFASDPLYKLGLLADLLNIPKIVENSILIWRPHPLTRASIKRYIPGLLEYYDTLTLEYINNGFRYNDVILDETEDYIPALMAADVLISDEGTLLRSYLNTGKGIMYIHDNAAKNQNFLDKSIKPSEGFYYFYSKDKTWYKVIKELAQGNDPLKDKRKDIINKAYVNTDGTAGEKVYKEIKNIVLSKDKSI